MSSPNYIIRPARPEDCDQIMKLVIELAEYEKMPEQVRIDADALRKDGFGDDQFFHCLVAEMPQQDEAEATGCQIVGYALYYYIFSPFEGRSCYMEDLYVTPACRGKGVGTTLWGEVIKIALDKGCSLLHWAVLDWNTPSIELYKRHGSINITEKEGWHEFRMTKAIMQDFVKQKGHLHGCNSASVFTNPSSH